MNLKSNGQGVIAVRNGIAAVLVLVVSASGVAGGQGKLLRNDSPYSLKNQFDLRVDVANPGWFRLELQDPALAKRCGVGLVEVYDEYFAKEVERGGISDLKFDLSRLAIPPARYKITWANPNKTAFASTALASIELIRGNDQPVYVCARGRNDKVDTPDQALALVAKSVVGVRVCNGGDCRVRSGFIINGYGYVVTAARLIQPSSAIEVILPASAGDASVHQFDQFSDPFPSEHHRNDQLIVLNPTASSVHRNVEWRRNNAHFLTPVHSQIGAPERRAPPKGTLWAFGVAANGVTRWPITKPKAEGSSAPNSSRAYSGAREHLSYECTKCESGFLGGPIVDDTGLVWGVFVGEELGSTNRSRAHWASDIFARFSPFVEQEER